SLVRPRCASVGIRRRARGRRSIRLSWLGRRRLLADRLRAGGRIGGRKGVVHFLVEHALLRVLRGVLGPADRAIRVAAALLHLSVGHVLLLPLVEENGHGRRKFPLWA